MVADDRRSPGTGESDISALCDTYLTLNGKRTELDRRLMALPADDQERDMLWDELEAISLQLPAIAAELAALPAQDPAGLRAKAAVLALLLQLPGTDSPALGPEATALAVSVADEVSRLV